MNSYSRALATLPIACALLLAGCANPGPPKPPSLGIPAPVADLKAERHGNTVELRFTLPQRTSDGVALRSGQIAARVCRAVDAGECYPLSGPMTNLLPSSATTKSSSLLRDPLPGDLASGAPRLLTYRIDLFGASGKSAGYSNPAFAAAGVAPKSVEGLRAEGSRLGVVLRWQAADPAAEVLLVRESLRTQATAEDKRGTHAGTRLNFDGMGKQRTDASVVTLSAGPEAGAESAAGAQSATLDTTAVAGEPYRYTAARKQRFDVKGHKLEVWSGASLPVAYTLRDSYPPPNPTRLSVAGFTQPDPQTRKSIFAVDLVWEPVQDERLGGYRIYREELVDKNGRSVFGSSRGTLLNPEPVKTPSFHDTTASGSKRYRYSVTSVDLVGNESDAATAVLEPQVF